MSFAIGIARVPCPKCGLVSISLVAELISSTSVACARCANPSLVADVEANDPELSRILAILRELEHAKALHVQRQDDEARSEKIS